MLPLETKNRQNKKSPYAAIPNSIPAKSPQPSLSPTPHPTHFQQKLMWFQSNQSKKKKKKKKKNNNKTHTQIQIQIRQLVFDSQSEQNIFI